MVLANPVAENASVPVQIRTSYLSDSETKSAVERFVNNLVSGQDEVFQFQMSFYRRQNLLKELEEYYRLWFVGNDVLETSASQFTKIDPLAISIENSASEIILEPSTVFSNTLIDERLDFIPRSIHEVTLVLNEGGRLDPNFQSDMEFNNYD